MNEYHTTDGGLQVITLGKFMELELPVRETLLTPWLTKESVNFIYAARGVGKTLFAMNIAFALATGKDYLEWKAQKPVSVLYIDGEMPAREMQDRFKDIAASTNTLTMPENLRLLPRSYQLDGNMPNLSNTEGLEAYSAHIENADVIILDNLSSLMYGVKENEADGWEPVAQWANKQRNKGKATIFIHHANKSGEQRGTSKREDIMDIVISLRRSPDYIAEEGARFTVNFEKARSIYGKDTEPFEAHLAKHDGTSSWKRIDQGVDKEAEEMVRLSNEGLSMVDIGAKFACDKATVSRKIKRLKQKQSA